MLKEIAQNKANSPCAYKIIASTESRVDRRGTKRHKNKYLQGGRQKSEYVPMEFSHLTAPPKSKLRWYNTALSVSCLCFFLLLGILLSVPLIVWLKLGDDLSVPRVIVPISCGALILAVLLPLNAVFMFRGILETTMLRPVYADYEHNGVLTTGKIVATDDSRNGRKQYVEYRLYEDETNSRCRIYEKKMTIATVKTAASCLGCSRGDEKDIEADNGEDQHVELWVLPNNPKSAIINEDESYDSEGRAARSLWKWFWDLFVSQSHKVFFVVGTTSTAIVNLAYWVNCRHFVPFYVLYPSMGLGLLTAALYVYARLGRRIWYMLNGGARLIGKQREDRDMGLL